MSKPVSQTLNLNKFNPAILEHKRRNGSSPNVVVVGKKGSGKSTLIKDLLYHLRGIDRFVCMSGTEDGNGYYGEFFHPVMVHSEYKPEVVKTLLSTQKEIVSEYKKVGKSPGPETSVGLLLDDCGYDKKVSKSVEFRQIFMNGRHWQITFILSLQYLMDLGPDLRTNVDYVFCLRDNTRNNQEKLFKNFFGCFANFAEFSKVFNDCTNNYECLVLDNLSKSSRLEDIIYWYKADPNRKFLMGSPYFRAYLNTKFNANYDENDEQPDESYKRNNSLIVKKKDIQ